MNLNELAREIHENAVKHGWWDGERDDAEIIALIHSEWSEALEEYRAGRPLMWYDCEAGLSRACCPGHGVEGYEIGICIDDKDCRFKQSKPEGIAVELIDGCIRILDYSGSRGVHIFGIGKELGFLEAITSSRNEYTLPKFVAYLHGETALCYNEDDGIKENKIGSLIEIVGSVCAWIRAHGLNPETIMREKHEYNKTREYKHGGKVC